MRPLGNKICCYCITFIWYANICLFKTGTAINTLVPRPIVSEIGFQSITIEWQACSKATKYAVIYSSVSSPKSKVLYSQNARYTFEDLNEKELYEFQVAVPGGNGQTGVWSQKSYPVLPSLQLGKLDWMFI